MNLSEICLECKNFFLKNGNSDIHSGTYRIQDGAISNTDFLIENQYFRIVGSKLNDGVYRNDSESLSKLANETFDGAIWDMSVPPAFVKMCEEISKWEEKYGGVNGVANSPYSSHSESFSKYSESWSKSSGGSNADGSASGNTWQGIYANQLRKWRRLNII